MAVKVQVMTTNGAYRGLARSTRPLCLSDSSSMMTTRDTLEIVIRALNSPECPFWMSESEFSSIPFNQRVSKRCKFESGWSSDLFGVSEVRAKVVTMNACDSHEMLN
jgi:hypothetical protein